MRIAFCGCQGTGKSSLAKRLSEYLGVPMLDEGGKLVEIAFGGEFDLERLDRTEKVLEWQKVLFEFRCFLHTFWEEYVSARGVLDNLAYTRYFAEKLNLQCEDLLEEMRANVREVFKFYDKVFYLPGYTTLEGGKRPKVDAVRLSWEFESLVREFSAEFPWKICSVPPRLDGSLDGLDWELRFSYILREIEFLEG